MRQLGTVSAGARFLITAASFVIVIMGMQAASAILVPFLLAAFFAILCSTPLLWLQRKGVPKILALIIVILGIVVIGTILVRFIGSSLAGLTLALPFYEARLESQEAALFSMVEDIGIDISDMVITDIVSAEMVTQTAGNILSALGGLLTNSFIILFTVIFMLLEASGFPTKLRAALGVSDVSLAHFNRISRGITSYLIIKTWMSLLTGLGVGVGLTLLNIDFAVLWGLAAFLFNYIPNIGSIIAAIPAVLLGFIQYGIESALYVALLYLIINNIVSYIIEPRFMGRGLDLSTLVVFLSLVFWGWVLGPVGLLLSPLLTVIVRIALESSEDTLWIAVLLGSESSAKTILHDQVDQVLEESLPPDREPLPREVSEPSKPQG